MTQSDRKPLLITISGLSGTGKSTAAKALATQIPNAVYIDSDETRKELFGVPATQKLPEDAYTWEATEKLIVETERRIKAHLAAGKNVVQSVMLVSDIARDRQEKIAAEAGAEFHGIWLQSDFKTMFDRVGGRKGDASDAGPDMVEQQQKWNIGTVTWPKVNANQPREDVLKEVLALIDAPVSPSSKAKPPEPQ